MFSISIIYNLKVVVINPDTKDTYKYFSFVYKSNDAFWLVQFATLAENADDYSSQIFEWAKTVTFE